ncbi:DNA-binding protein [Aerococcaceae bacterium zg-BR22]|uniref:PPC domain-containing DNA-binding protein n=1 Tax=Aerococcaceae bacterium zg-1292 TaxID=2774330 RepID=UPI0040645B80|nr:DNA-binding protein [Aerococcaceae bacterium zg-BR22]
MEYQRISNQIIVRFDRGDWVMDNLIELTKKENIRAAYMSGIGAFDLAQLNFFFWEKQDYETKAFEEEFEVLSLNGNFSINNGEPHIHLHTALGRSDYSTIGGHLNDARVSITLELFIEVLDTTLTRQSVEHIQNFKQIIWNN